jgi:hypothetical protein
MKMAETVKSWAQELVGYRASLDKVRGAEQAKRAEYDRLQAERLRLLGAPGPKAEIITNIRALVAQHARDFEAAAGPALVRAASGRVAVDGAEKYTGTIAGTLPQEVLAAPLSFGAWCSFDAAAVTAWLTRLVSGQTFEEGPALAARERALADIDQKIETVIGEHAELVDAAQAAGVGLPHLAETIGRRTRVQQRMEAVRRTLAANRDALHYGRIKPADLGISAEELAEVGWQA